MTAKGVGGSPFLPGEAPKEDNKKTLGRPGSKTPPTTRRFAPVKGVDEKGNPIVRKQGEAAQKAAAARSEAFKTPPRVRPATPSVPASQSGTVQKMEATAHNKPPLNAAQGANPEMGTQAKWNQKNLAANPIPSTPPQTPSQTPTIGSRTPIHPGKPLPQPTTSQGAKPLPGHGASLLPRPSTSNSTTAGPAKPQTFNNASPNNATTPRSQPVAQGPQSPPAAQSPTSSKATWGRSQPSIPGQVSSGSQTASPARPPETPQPPKPAPLPSTPSKARPQPIVPVQSGSIRSLTPPLSRPGPQTAGTKKAPSPSALPKTPVSPQTPAQPAVPAGKQPSVAITPATGFTLKKTNEPPPKPSSLPPLPPETPAKGSNRFVTPPPSRPGQAPESAAVKATNSTSGRATPPLPTSPAPKTPPTGFSTPPLTRKANEPAKEARSPEEKETANLPRKQPGIPSASSKDKPNPPPPLPTSPAPKTPPTGFSTPPLTRKANVGPVKEAAEKKETLRKQPEIPTSSKASNDKSGSPPPLPASPAPKPLPHGLSTPTLSRRENVEPPKTEPKNEPSKAKAGPQKSLGEMEAPKTPPLLRREPAPQPPSTPPLARKASDDKSSSPTLGRKEEGIKKGSSFIFSSRTDNKRDSESRKDYELLKSVREQLEKTQLTDSGNELAKYLLKAADKCKDEKSKGMLWRMIIAKMDKWKEAKGSKLYTEITKNDFWGMYKQMKVYYKLSDAISTGNFDYMRKIGQEIIDSYQVSENKKLGKEGKKQASIPASRNLLLGQGRYQKLSSTPLLKEKLSELKKNYAEALNEKISNLESGKKNSKELLNLTNEARMLAYISGMTNELRAPYINSLQEISLAELNDTLQGLRQAKRNPIEIKKPLLALSDVALLKEIEQMQKKVGNLGVLLKNKEFDTHLSEKINNRLHTLRQEHASLLHAFNSLNKDSAKSTELEIKLAELEISLEVLSLSAPLEEKTILSQKDFELIDLAKKLKGSQSSLEAMNTIKQNFTQADVLTLWKKLAILDLASSTKRTPSANEIIGFCIQVFEDFYREELEDSFLIKTANYSRTELNNSPIEQKTKVQALEKRLDDEKRKLTEQLISITDSFIKNTSDQKKKDKIEKSLDNLRIFIIGNKDKTIPGINIANLAPKYTMGPSGKEVKDDSARELSHKQFVSHVKTWVEAINDAIDLPKGKKFQSWEDVAKAKIQYQAKPDKKLKADLDTEIVANSPIELEKKLTSERQLFTSLNKVLPGFVNVASYMNLFQSPAFNDTFYDLIKDYHAAKRNYKPDEIQNKLESLLS